MSNKFVDKLKHIAFEDEPETTKPNPSKPTGTSTVAAAPAYSVPASVIAPSASTAPVLDNDTIYQRLAGKTDFNNTATANIINKYLAPLADQPLDANMKFKIAVAQAKAQEGLTPEKIVATFDGLKTVLQAEEKTFAETTQTMTDKMIVGRQNQIQKLSERISELQEELAQLQGQVGTISTELVDAQGKVSRAQNQFAAAIQRRTLELDQQKAQYTASLKG